MYRYRIPLLLAAIAVVAPLRAQQAPPSPHVGYVFPAGGQRGQSFDVTVGGQLLQQASAIRVSGGGVRCGIATYKKPLTQGQFNNLRNKMDIARDKLEAAGTRVNYYARNLADPVERARLAKLLGITEEEMTLFYEFNRDRQDPKKQLNVQIAETLVVRVTVDPSAAPGERELHVVTANGISNPIRFVVGTLPERTETEPNEKTPDAGIERTPVVVNGQILPGDVDRYSFSARAGQKLVIAAQARSLIPYLADAVPGWFQATLSLRDAAGREVAFDDDFRFQPDPVLFYTVPADGRYTLEIHDSIYRGREDFVYRITLGEVPYVTDIFPLGGRDSEATAVQLRGWNLPQETVTVAAQPGAARLRTVAATGGEAISNAAPFAVDTLPEVREAEPNDATVKAQNTAWPAIVNGRIDRPGDIDVYRISGKAGQVVVAEVLARRLNSPLDSVLALSDAKGKRLTLSDDVEDREAALVTHQSDSRLSLTLPTDGVYYLTLRDAQQKGGPEYAYRLRISAPRPDFALRVVPSSVSARPAAKTPITVYVVRRDGFKGEIALSLKDAQGFSLSADRIPAGQDQVKLTLSAPFTPREEPYSLALEGRATLPDGEIRRRATPAEDMMQAFAYRHLVPAEEWLVAVTGRRNVNSKGATK